MTVVAYRDGVMASDSQINCSGLNWAEARKVASSPDNKVIAGASGVLREVAKFLDWVEAGASGSYTTAEKDFTALLYREGMLWRVEAGGTFKINAPYLAIGSGERLALGAMFCNASATDAVKAACHHETSCGGPTQVKIAAL